MNFPRFKLSLPLAVVAAAVLGCNTDQPPATYKVSGLVEYGGTPVSGATVTFHPVDNDLRTAVAKTDEKGAFQLTTVKENDGAMPGKYRITVTKLVIEGDTGPASSDIAAPPRKVTVKSELPEKFGSPETSGLEGTVEPIAQNELDVILPK